MERLFALRSLAIMGMGKNTGKTSFLNLMIRESLERPERILALTSVGRDGEERDLTLDTDKPRIYVTRGTLIATAEALLPTCDLTKEILAVTGIRSAMGKIIILRALSDGYCEIAGPSRAGDLICLERQMRDFEKDCLFIVDGALSRMSFSSRTEGAVLMTGMSLCGGEKRILRRTLHSLRLVCLPETGFVPPGEKGRAFLFKDHWVKIEGDMAVSLKEDLKDALVSGVGALYLKGAVTDGIMETLLLSPCFRDLALIGEDGTKLLLSEGMVQRLIGRNIRLEVMKKINVKKVIVNPYDADGKESETGIIMKGLERASAVPVYSLKDLKGDGHEPFQP